MSSSTSSINGNSSSTSFFLFTKLQAFSENNFLKHSRYEFIANIRLSSFVITVECFFFREQTTTRVYLNIQGTVLLILIITTDDNDYCYNGSSYSTLTTFNAVAMLFSRTFTYL